MDANIVNAREKRSMRVGAWSESKREQGTKRDRGRERKIESMSERESERARERKDKRER